MAQAQEGADLLIGDAFDAVEAAHSGAFNAACWIGHAVSQVEHTVENIMPGTRIPSPAAVSGVGSDDEPYEPFVPSPTAVMLSPQSPRDRFIALQPANFGMGWSKARRRVTYP